jgi:magnesium chelatase family protein
MFGTVSTCVLSLRWSLAASHDMLFKTQSASVYGIDAYLVEVEVDMGSARMQDFNVVGLSDNTVKESRERIKSAL